MLLSHWTAGEKAGDGTRFWHRLIWPRIPSIPCWPQVSDSPAGIRAVPPHPIQNHHFSLKNILKPHRCLCLLYKNCLPYHHFKGPRRQDPHVNHSPHTESEGGLPAAGFSHVHLSPRMPCSFRLLPPADGSI